jgi:formylglycine-generating enzyme required for sulfatase activity
MGKYPITQAQWRAVASLPKIEHDLTLNPSHFTGDNHPVERVSWEDAVEFCKRLSKLTGKDYTLPSEARWEYACRAGTTTPFHCGETITPDLANYQGTERYGNGPKGSYRQTTTPVSQFSPNAFGLYDMHGNVWEWCEDNWRGNYQGNPPTDGSAWKESGSNSNVLRGGSWYFYPAYCRSANRLNSTRSNRNSNLGFRVMWVSGRTL